MTLLYVPLSKSWQPPGSPSLEFCHFGNVRKMELYGIWPLQTVFILSAEALSPMQAVGVSGSCLFNVGRLSAGWLYQSLLIHSLLRGVRGLSSRGLLQVELLCTSGHRCCCGPDAVLSPQFMPRVVLCHRCRGGGLLTRQRHDGTARPWGSRGPVGEQALGADSSWLKPPYATTFRRYGRGAGPLCLPDPVDIRTVRPAGHTEGAATGDHCLRGRTQSCRARSRAQSPSSCVPVGDRCVWGRASSRRQPPDPSAARHREPWGSC